MEPPTEPPMMLSGYASADDSLLPSGHLAAPARVIAQDLLGRARGGSGNEILDVVAQRIADAEEALGEIHSLCAVAGGVIGGDNEVYGPDLQAVLDRIRDYFLKHNVRAMP